MIFGINTTSDISKLLYEIGEWKLRQCWNITSGIYAKYHVQIMLLFVFTTTSKRFVIFTSRYFKLSWNTTALSQSNCRNFSCSSIRLHCKRLISIFLCFAVCKIWRFSNIIVCVVSFSYNREFVFVISVK